MSNKNATLIVLSAIIGVFIAGYIVDPNFTLLGICALCGFFILTVLNVINVDKVEVMIGDDGPDESSNSKTMQL